MLGFKGVADNEEPALLGGAGGSTLLEFGVVAVEVVEGDLEAPVGLTGHDFCVPELMLVW